MRTKTAGREYFFDSIRASLMLLGIPFHLSLIYSAHHWSVNSEVSSAWLTIFNDFIHAFRMQVFFVISGYFSYMLYLRYQPQQWLKFRAERIGIPLLSAIPLITLPQFFILLFWTEKGVHWSTLSPYQKYNVLVWDLVSHLWFLLVLMILTTLSYFLFKLLNYSVHSGLKKTEKSQINWTNLTLFFLLLGIAWALLRRMIFIFKPHLLSDALFNFTVMQSLFYLPFYFLGALAWKYTVIKDRLIKFNCWTLVGAVIIFALYLLNQRLNDGGGWLYECDAIITMLMGIWMVNVVFALGYKLLNSHSPGISYLVNASLFIYLIHHPLTLLYGIFITPMITSNTLGFLIGLIGIFGIAFILYEIQRRIPVLAFLFSGKTVAR